MIVNAQGAAAFPTNAVNPQDAIEYRTSVPGYRAAYNLAEQVAAEAAADEKRKMISTSIGGGAALFILAGLWYAGRRSK